MPEYFCGKGSREGTNLYCYKKGFGVGNNLDLYGPPKHRVYKHIYCGEQRTPSDMVRGNRYECFKKGIEAGKKVQWYGFDLPDISIEGILLTILVGVILFGLLSSMGASMTIAIIIGFFVGIGFAAFIWWTSQ